MHLLYVMILRYLITIFDIQVVVSIKLIDRQHYIIVHLSIDDYQVDDSLAYFYCTFLSNNILAAFSFLHVPKETIDLFQCIRK